MLRRVDGDRASVWVETDRPATVCVVAGEARGEARTFRAFGHHYALVVVAGLVAGATTPYRVELDGHAVWPPPDDRFPPCRIRTGTGGGGDGRVVRVVFGSCREGSPYTGDPFPPDAVDAFACRLAEHADEPDRWPDLLVMLGDQVYADEVSPATRRFLRRHRELPAVPVRGEPEDQVNDFAEYSRLYDESWTDPEIRWLLSTVPSAMIFDDHEIVDDWNTSAAWRERVTAQPWWRRRITGGLASYWVYQHLGNLPIDELADDPLAVRAGRGEDLTGELIAMARRVDTAADPGGETGSDEAGDAARAPHWCQRRDLGRTRLLVLDNRCGRVLTPRHRSMLSAADWAWLEDSVRGDVDHLVVCASLPWLLPPAVHHLEAATEKLCDSPRRPVAALAEWVRQGADMEHWAAFRDSFERLGRLLADVGRGRYGPPPASITVLSGDVHHSYLARADLGAGVRTPIWQLTCSPTHHQAPPELKVGFRVGWSRTGAAIGAALARLSGVPRPGPSWQRLAGPYFRNALGTLELAGRTARVVLEGTDRDPDGTARLISMAGLPLTGDDHD
jgi:hypothetical protein